MLNAPSSSAATMTSGVSLKSMKLCAMRPARRNADDPWPGDLESLLAVIAAPQFAFRPDPDLPGWQPGVLHPATRLALPLRPSPACPR